MSPEPFFIVLVVVGALLFALLVVETVMFIWFARHGISLLADKIAEKLWDEIQAAEEAEKAEEEGRPLDNVEKVWGPFPPLDTPEPSPAPQEAAEPQEPATEPVPRFGRVLPKLYFPQNYEEPLRCSIGTTCGGRQLHPAEGFYEIEDLSDPDGARVIVVCAEDVLMLDGVKI